MILSCLISLSVIFLVKCNEDWLYLQVHTDDATCLSTVKQIEAVRVGRCQRDTTLFSVLFPNYPIQKYIDFSYQILLTSYTDDDNINSGGSGGEGSSIPPITPGDISGDNKFNSTSLDDDWSNQKNSSTSEPSKIILTGSKDISPVIIGNTSTDDGGNAGGIYPFAQFLIYHSNHQCQGEMDYTEFLSIYDPYQSSDYLNLPTTFTSYENKSNVIFDDWVVNGCQINQRAVGEGAISLKYLLNGSSISFIMMEFVNKFVVEETFFENYENATCSSDTTLRCTISLSDSCITLNGATSTSYQCNNGRDNPGTITSYNESSQCDWDTSSYVANTTNTCPVSDTRTTPTIIIQPRNIHYHHFRSLAYSNTLHEDDLYHQVCKIEARTIGYPPSPYPVMVPSAAPTIRTTPALDIMVSFKIINLESNDPLLITSGSKVSAKFHLSISTLVCAQLQLPDETFCHCVEGECLSLTSLTYISPDPLPTPTPSPTFQDTVVEIVFPSKHTQDISIRGNDHTKVRGPTGLYDYVHSFLQSILLRLNELLSVASTLILRDRNIESDDTIIHVDPGVTTKTINILFVKVNVTVNTVDFYSSTLPSSVNSMTESVSEYDAAVNETMTILSLRLQGLSTSYVWYGIASLFTYDYPNWFSDGNAVLQDTHLEVAKIYNPLDTTPTHYMTVPTYAPSPVPTTSLLDEVTTNSHSSTNTLSMGEILGLSLSIGGLIVLPAIAMATMSTQHGRNWFKCSNQCGCGSEDVYIDSEDGGRSDSGDLEAGTRVDEDGVEEESAEVYREVVPMEVQQHQNESVIPADSLCEFPRVDDSILL